MNILPIAVATAGRQSTRDLCLRFEPSTEKVNHEKSMKISSHHFSLRYVGTGVQFVDVGSTNGSIFDSKRVQPNLPVLVDRQLLISVADILELVLEPVGRLGGLTMSNDLCEAASTNAGQPEWLQNEFIGVDKPGSIDFLRVKRVNNLPDTQYVLLYHSGRIGSSHDCLLPAFEFNATASRKRALDLGDAEIADSPARLLVRGKVIWLERTGNSVVTVSGKSLEVGQCCALAPGEMTIAGMTYSVRYV
jgi:hypothetical protein